MPVTAYAMLCDINLVKDLVFMLPFTILNLQLATTISEIKTAHGCMILRVLHGYEAQHLQFL